MNPNVKVIQLSGILDSISGSQLRQKIDEVITAGSRVVLLDCAAVEFMDSSGLGALVMALKKIREVGGKFSICCINDQFRMLLELTDMEEVFEIFSNQDEFDQSIALA
jgi:anti-sigma B factor antagonist